MVGITCPLLWENFGFLQEHEFVSNGTIAVKKKIITAARLGLACVGFSNKQIHPRTGKVKPFYGLKMHN